MIEAACDVFEQGRGRPNTALCCDGLRRPSLPASGRRKLHVPRGSPLTLRAAKTSQTRVIELHPSAVAWLKHWERDAGPNVSFVVKGHRERWDRLRQEAGLADNGVHDVLRHSFASMHYAAFQNASQLRALMGHSQNENTLFSHYRAVQTVAGTTLTNAMAEEFWSLHPEQGRIFPRKGR